MLSVSPMHSLSPHLLGKPQDPEQLLGKLKAQFDWEPSLGHISNGLECVASSLTVETVVLGLVLQWEPRISITSRHVQGIWDPCKVVLNFNIIRKRYWLVTDPFRRQF